MKIRYFLILSCFLLPPFAVITLEMVKDNIRVGIVTVDSIPGNVVEIINEGINQKGKGFTSIDLEISISSEDIGQDQGFYLISDLLNRMRDQVDPALEGVDVLLLITDLKINDWDETGHAYWGKAMPEYDGSVMTYNYWQDDLEGFGWKLKQIALHELYHLLGYTHNYFDTSGLMQYAKTDRNDDLSFAYRVQLGARIISYPLYRDLGFRGVMLVSSTIFSLIVLPFYIGLETLIRSLRKKMKIEHTPPVWLSIFLISVAFMMIIPFNGAIYNFLLPGFFMIFIYFLHHMMERSSESRISSER